MYRLVAMAATEAEEKVKRSRLELASHKQKLISLFGGLQQTEQMRACAVAFDNEMATIIADLESAVQWLSGITEVCEHADN